jgi:hypothetical protein
VCRKPLRSGNPISQAATVNTANAAIQIPSQVRSDTPAITTLGHALCNTEPESTIRIKSCGHIFGELCLDVCFTQIEPAHNLTTFIDDYVAGVGRAVHNSCPECGEALFPAIGFHLVIREPTRAMRRAFVMVVGVDCEDLGLARDIGNDLMSGAPRYRCAGLSCRCAS